MRALRKLRRDYPREAYVFVSERGGPISPIGFHRLIQRLGEAAKMPFPEAIARREAGEALTDIARTFGVHHTTIGRLRA
jgi:hypothetical protein